VIAINNESKLLFSSVTNYGTLQTHPKLSFFVREDQKTSEEILSIDEKQIISKMANPFFTLLKHIC
jgi:hypothetical protein